MITWVTKEHSRGHHVEVPTTECRTAGCFAGWRAIKDGYVQVQHRNYNSYTLVNPANGNGVVFDGPGRPRQGLHQYGPDTVAEYARVELGLTDYEASELFASENDMSMLKHLVDELCTQPGRSEQSKAKLRETLDDVLAADAEGLWYQGKWIGIVPPE
jgi:hypothetical protein